MSDTDLPADTICLKCGRELSGESYKITWKQCHFCDKPICFNCIHYFGTHLTGLYSSYVDVRGVCEKCMPVRNR